MAREKLGEILIRAGILDEEGLRRALNEQKRWGGHLGRYLVELGLISEEILVRALSTQYKIPAVAIDASKMDLSVGQMIPKDICERNNLICFRHDPQRKFIDVAMADPSNLDAIDEVRIATKCNVRPHIAAPSQIDKAINLVFYGEINFGSELELQADPSSRGETPPSKSSDIDRPIFSDLKPRRKTASDSEKLKNWQSISIGAGGGASPPAVDIPLKVKKKDFDSVELPPPIREENVHITLDVPVADKVEIAKISVEDQLHELEATVARDSAMIKVLFDGLMAKKLFTSEEVRQLIAKADSIVKKSQ